MNDFQKTKAQLLQEVQEIRRWNAELEKAESEHRRSARELQENRAHLQSLIEMPSNFAIYRLICDKENPSLIQVVRASPSIKDILGVSDPLRMESLYEIIHPDDLEGFLAANLTAFETHQFNESFRIFHSQKKEWRWIQAVSTEALDEKTNTLYVNGILLDITDQKKAEEVLRRSAEDTIHQNEMKLRLITDNIRDTVWLMDLDFKTTWISPSITRNQGYTLEELADLPLDRQLTPDSYDKVVRIISEMMTPERLGAPNVEISTNLELEICRKDGSTYWSDTVTTVLRDSTGKPVGILGVGRDITERKQMEKELREALLQYHEEANRSQKLAQENEILARIGRIIGSSLNIGDIYEAFAQEALKLIPFEGLAVNIINHQDSTVSIPYVFGPELASGSKGDMIPLEDSITGALREARSGMIVRLEDLPTLKKKYPKIAGRFEKGLKSAILVPLISKDIVIGALHFRSLSLNAYTRRHLEIAEKVALQIAGAIANAQLFEEVRKNEEALRTSEKRYRLLTDKMSDVIWIRDIELKCLYVSPSVERLTGFTVEEALNQTMEEAFTPDSTARARKILQEELTGKKDQCHDPVETRTFEMEALRKDGSTVWTETTATFLRDGSGRVYGIQGSFRDITERKRSDEELKRSLSLLHAALESTADGILVVDRGGRIVSWNRKFVAMWNIPEEIMAGREDKKAIDYVLSQLAEPEQWLSKVKELYVHPEESSFDRIAFKDGRFFERYSQPQKIDNNIVGRVWSFRDITDRQRAEEKLQQSEEKYRFLAEKMADIVWVLDMDFRTTYVSPSIEKVLGFTIEERRQQTLAEMITPESLQQVQTKWLEELQREKDQTTDSDRSIVMEVEYRRKDGSTIWMENTIKANRDQTGMIVGIYGVSRDISEKKQMEEQRIVLSKLESTGILAGGIAHDFNNLLAVIMGNLGLIEILYQSREDFLAPLKAAQKAALEARGLTQQFVTLSTGGDPVKKLTSLSGLIQDQVSLALAGSSVEAKISVPPGLRPVLIDEGQIRQVIRNMALNAREASPDAGTISIEVEDLELSSTSILTLSPGPYLKISVSDQGVGITEEDLPKIFDPYFSTKQRGTQKGMGLGLTICHSIISKHGGTITVESKAELGTTFRIYLPASGEIVPEKSSPLKDLPGACKVLIMDDESMMRAMLSSILRRLGYEVATAENGERTISAYQSAKDLGRPFDVVILDLTIRGGMGGLETIRRLQEIDPTVRAIVASGYDHDPVMQHFADYGFKAALSKPFLIDELNNVLEDILKKN